jgi:hypothetical protein
MADIVRLKHAHPLVGTWRHADKDFGTSVQFTVLTAGEGFDVRGIDTADEEPLVVSDVRWDGRVLRFKTFVPSTGHGVDYAMEVESPNELLVACTYREPWVRADSSAS